MDNINNSNSLSDSIFKSNDQSFNFGSNDDTTFLDSLRNINITTWIIIILILAFLGINVFVYLAKGTQTISDFFSPILGLIANITGQTIDVSAEGAKAIVNETASTLNTGLTDIQNITPNNVSKIQENNSSQQQNNVLNNVLNNSQRESNDYQAHEANSSIGSIEKAGWCYVGEDRGFRTCAQVTANDKCMSGDIFPSHEICVNPNLRT